MWSLSILFSFLHPAHAWEAKKNSHGSVLHWLQKDISFYYHNQTAQLTDMEIEDAMNKAGAAWSFSNINLNNAGKGIASQIDHEDDQFSIVFQESWDEDPEILALTYTWSKSDGEMSPLLALQIAEEDWDI